MNTADLITYLAILVSMTIAPGPLMAVIIARTLGRDIIGAAALTLGIATGNVLIVVLVREGLALYINEMPGLFDAAKVLALIYLMWVARDMWFSREVAVSEDGKSRTGAASSFVAGIGTCLVSPHYLLFYMLILPRLMDVAAVSNAAFGMLVLATFGALLLTFGLVIALTDQLRARTVSAAGSMVLNRVLATVIASSGVWMVAS